MGLPLGRQRQIRIAAPIINPFLQPAPAETSATPSSFAPHALSRQLSIQAGETFGGGGVGKKSDRKSVNIWIAPFKERPRYMSDFDQEGTKIDHAHHDLNPELTNHEFLFAELC